MKIAILGSRGYPYVYSGYETFVDRLAPSLALRGHAVVVYCHKRLFVLRPPVVKGVHLIYLPALERKTLSQFSHTLLSTLHAVASDADVLLYVNSANGPFGLITAFLRRRTVINVDGLEWLRPKWRGLGAKYFRIASYLATKFFDVIVTDSDRMAEIYKSEFDAESVTIAYGADLGVSTQPGLIQELGLVPQSYYLVVGRLVPDNNADLIVRGYGRTKTARRLVVLGDVPYRDRYAESVRHTKDARIFFPGYVRDQDLLRELYCNSFAYIHGHEFGGTNPALLKALGYGCCVLALKTPFNEEVLANGQHGVYFAKNEESFGSAIDFLERNGNLVNSMRATARSRILEKYMWDMIIDKYEQLFITMNQHR